MDASKSVKRLAFVGFLHPFWELGIRQYFTDHHTPYAIDGFEDSVLVCEIHDFCCRIRKNFEEHVSPSHLKVHSCRF